MGEREPGLDAEDLANLRHALGVEPARPRTQWGFRNYFACDKSGPDADSMVRLADAGLMHHTHTDGNLRYYSATLTGCLAAGMLHGDAWAMEPTPRDKSENETRAWAKVEEIAKELTALRKRLTFAQLREANLARLPQFRDRRGRLCHQAGPSGKIDGTDWNLSQWSNAVCGELGEAANLVKKIERGDFTLDEARVELGKELADVVTYLDIFAAAAGIDLGEATRAKFNEVSDRVGSDVRL